MTDKKVGRPCKGDIPFTTTIKDEIVKDLSYGMSIKTACKLNGISQTTFFEYVKVDEDFMKRCNRAIQETHRKAYGKLQENIDKNDERAIEFYLGGRTPDFVQKSEQSVELRDSVISIKYKREEDADRS